MEPVVSGTLVEQIAQVLALLVGLVLTRYVVPIVRNLFKQTDEKLNAQAREALYPALQYAIAYARGTLSEDQAAKLQASEEMKSHVVNLAVRYARDNVGDTLERLKITDAALQDLLHARLQSALDYLKIPAAK